VLSYPGHLIAGAAALAATLGVSSLTINRQVKRKLRLSTFLIGAYLVLYAALSVVPAVAPQAGSQTELDLLGFANLALAAALINLLVVSLLNPLREDRIPDRFPTILQDAIVIGLVLLVATFAFNDKLVTTSAVSAVVIGFALQDTLGNAFAGLALQSEKPFHVGDWIRVADFEGRVAEITWRATKLRTKTGNFVILPNNFVSKEAITNYSQPAAPTRIEVEVGASYLAAPNAVKAVVMEAVANAPRALKAPAPDVLLVRFDNSAITYRARFWIEDYESDEAARDQIRSAIYYSFARHGIEIPWPIQIQYEREWQEPDAQAALGERERLLAAIDLFAALTEDERRELAAGTSTRTYGDGEAIVRQGEAGQSMFVLCSGGAIVVLESDRRQVATIEAGGYFGEMSLLTGEPRSATVLAKGDAVVIELDAGQFRRLGERDPGAVEQIGMAAMTRRAALDELKSAARGAAVADAPATFLARMKSFLRL
jgi:small-conductance mechanosensitive channel/CRP-like cAMP-binding protein